MCFIDYSKAFHTVKHEILFESLQHLDLDGKDLRIMRNVLGANGRSKVT